MKKFTLEICTGSTESALISQKAAADRVELCDNLFEGGTTPSYGSIKLARKNLKIGLQVIIRPRGGDFCYSDLEFEIMKEDIKFAKEIGVDGVVIGILNPDGTVDKKRSAELIELARPMNVTFHRAFDMTRDPFEALEDIISIGADRILTSGQEKSAIEGMFLIKDLIEKAGDRIIIMPGAGLTLNNMDRFLEYTGAKEIHVADNEYHDSKMEFRPNHIYMGGYLHLPEFGIEKTSLKGISKIAKKRG